MRTRTYSVLALSVALFLLFAARPALAQSGWVLDTYPPREPLRQIRTPHFRLIFPEDTEDQARDLALTLEHLYLVDSSYYGVSPPRIDLLLHTETTISNGYVTLGPRHSVFYLTPIQSDTPGFGIGTTTRWSDTLALHEFRHIAQFDASRQGMTRWSYALFGEGGWSLFSALAWPWWFWEGDAVVAETMFSRSGRGRVPGFDLQARAFVQERGLSGYNRMVLPSFRLPRPDHYTLGYLMNVRGRRQHGAQLWADVSGHAARWPLVPFAFSWSLRRETGYNLPRLYRETMTELREVWTEQLAEIELTEAETIHAGPPPDVYRNYYSPQSLPDGGAVAYVAGFDEPGSFVRIDPAGNEQRIASTGFRLEESFSVVDGRIAYADLNFDTRWIGAQTNSIRILDIGTGRVETLVRSSRYFSPQLSTDGSQIVAVEVSESGESSLVILGSSTGDVLVRYGADPGDSWMMPRWSDDGAHVVFVKQDVDGGRTIELLDVVTGSVTTVVPHTDDALSTPIVAGGFVYYSSPWSGVDAIYATELGTGATYQVCVRRLAAFSPSVSEDGGSLLFSDYTFWGFRVARIDLDRSRWIPLEDVERRPTDYFAPLLDQEPAGDLLATVPDAEESDLDLASEPYSDGPHRLRLHSWSPAYIEVSERWGSTLGFRLGLADTTQTTILSAGWQQNLNNGTFFGELSGSYQGWYPIVDLDIGYGHRVVSFADPSAEWSDFRTVSAQWDVLRAGGALRVPLDFSGGPWMAGLSVGSGPHWLEVHDFESEVAEGSGEEPEILAGSLGTLDTEASVWVARISSWRDLAPRIGASASVWDHRALPISDTEGFLSGGALQLYLPGLLAHNSVMLAAQTETRDYYGYPFLTGTWMPRGYGEEEFGWESRHTLTAQYDFPVAYPDAVVGPFLGIARVRGNFWGDLARLDGVVDDMVFDRTLASAGGGVAVDMNVFRLPMLIPIGVDAMYRFYDWSWTWQITMGTPE